MNEKTKGYVWPALGLLALLLIVALAGIACGRPPATAQQPLALPTAALAPPTPVLPTVPSPTISAPSAATPADIPIYGYRVVRVYPHDPGAFTQGLVYEDGYLYEGTGLWGRSSLRKVELETGTVLQSRALDPQYFGEGITIWHDRIVQLTWQSYIGFVYDKASFAPLGTFSYPTEGWGLTHDGTRLIMSDGTSTLYFLDPETYQRIGQVQVTAAGLPVTRLNELEYVRGEVYANIWQTDRIARIDPVTGRVRAWVDLTGLLPAEDRTQPVDVLNGIAYDAAGDRLFVTGKLWPKLFEIELVPARAYVPLIRNGTARPPASVTILHTNDFHGHLESDANGTGGAARLSTAIRAVRQERGADAVLLLDAGDMYLGGHPISEVLDGESTIDIFNRIGYGAATFGNHEFDLGLGVLISRTAQSAFPWLSANIVREGTEWEHPNWAQPYVILSVGSEASRIRLGIIGLTTPETELVTEQGRTAGLVFRDPTEAILHYYDTLLAHADAVIVLAHIGTEDNGPYKGLRRVARELNDAGKPVALMIAGHQHVPLFWPVRVGETTIVQAGFHGRWLGRVDVRVEPASKRLTVEQTRLIPIIQSLEPDADVGARVSFWAAQVAERLGRPVGVTNVALMRNYNSESNLGNLVADGMRWKADELDDGLINDSISIALTNPGGLRQDFRPPAGASLPYPLTWGDTRAIMPFRNTLFLMDLTGAQIQTLLDQSASLYKGILQTSGARWSWHNDCRCRTPSRWGAFNIEIAGAPLVASGVYRVVTNSFLAGGQDGWVTFAEGTRRLDTLYDMQEAINDYIGWYNAAVGPLDHRVEGRIRYSPTAP